jgi:hypothetical protein
MGNSLICPHCGREHPAGAGFCPITGKPLGGQAQNSSATMPDLTWGPTPSVDPGANSGQQTLVQSRVDSPGTLVDEAGAKICPNCKNACRQAASDCPTCGYDFTQKPWRVPIIVWVLAPAIIFLCVVGTLIATWFGAYLFDIPLPSFFPSAPKIAFLQTSTPTPTQTPVSTVTRTPTKTLKPTITLYPTLASTLTRTPTFAPTDKPLTTLSINPQYPDSAIKRGRYSAQIIDAKGVVYLAYLNDENDCLMFTRYSNGQWDKGSVLSNIYRDGFYNSIALDKDGIPWISYFNFNDKKLFLINALNPADKYELKNVNVVDTALVIDTNNVKHIAFIDIDHDTVVYATLDNSTHKLTSEAPIDSANAYDYDDVKREHNLLNVDIALDANNNPCIVYFKYPEGLKMACKVGGGWHKEVIESGPKVGWYPALAFDEQGIARVSYYDAAQRALKYSARYNNTWSTPVTVDGGNVGEYSDISVSPTGLVFIGYYDRTNDNLHLAYTSGVNWGKKDVNNPRDGGWEISLDLDPDGNPHLSYFNDVQERLGYVVVKVK